MLEAGSALQAQPPTRCRAPCRNNKKKGGRVGVVVGEGGAKKEMIKAAVRAHDLGYVCTVQARSGRENGRVPSRAGTACRSRRVRRCHGPASSLRLAPRRVQRL